MFLLYFCCAGVREGLLSRKMLDVFGVLVMENLVEQVGGKGGKVCRIVDKVLRQVFGEEAADLIFRYLESNYSVRRDEVAEKIDVFAVGLEEFLRSGAYVVERKILEDIYSNYGLLRRLELERVREEGDFASQVKSLMRRA